ncbi:arginase family protein [Vulcanisaeta thermophila]|uniref:arginase family protein n=1 Tax=Vulcanisaeta thermophila TaxID=867917 RepID=UPI0008534FAE|nr:arginase family protein [Vulcanisaeta thermophila]
MIEFYTGLSQTLFGVRRCGDGIPVLGIPMEDTLSFRPGTRFATSVIRQWSQYFEFTPTRDLGVDVLSRVCDMGDVSLLQGLPERNISRIERVVSEAVGRWGRLVNIGGEHTVSLGVALGLRDSLGYGAYIHIDAHLDSRSEWPLGQSLSHATFVRRLIKDVKPELILYLGFRSYDNEELDFINELGNAVALPGSAIKSLGNYEARALIRDFMSTVGGPIHVSIDLDVLDPSIMPGVGNPEGNGLTYNELLRVLEPVLELGGSRVGAVDIVEYSPPNDPNLTSLPTVIKLIIDVLNYLR